MLFLPLEEDSWLFRLCLYYGLLVLLLELLVPLVFHRRVRVEIPRLALHGPAVPLSTREFMQRRRALQQQLAALQRALAETPRRSPRKRKQLLDASAAKDRPDASPSPSRVASPTSSVKVSRLQSSRGTSNSKSQIQRRSERKDGREEQRDRDAARQRREDKVVDGEEDQVPSQRPAAMNNSSGTRPAQSGGFSFNEVAREEKKEEENQASWHEPVVWEQAVSMKAARRRESPTSSGRRPVRLVSEDAGAVIYNGPSEAASRLEALIRARRRARTPPVYVPPPSQPLPTATVPSPSPPLEEVPVTGIEESLEYSASHAPKQVPHSIPSPIGQQDERNANEDEEETKDSEQHEPLTDFQAFCSSFATGGSAAAQKAITKRKHHEAFGSEDEQANDGAGVAQQSVEKRKQLRVFEQDEKQVDDDVTIAATHSAEKRKRHEVFGSEDENASGDAVEADQVLEKRTHAEAFGAEDKPDRPQEKTPRIARRISFSDEVAALSAASPKEVPGGRSNVKRKHQQAFGMIDEEDEDADWRESLAFRPHRSG
ncbi:hypothetical protein PR003_g23954 [Phytophthora rubi]|uniref:Transmembrane protein n=1 Tax=Phytophthora rubi TaxID=129364 RepID=A0A6A3ISS1_9STRA|nr:hypothetical protein PR001_g22717 [Phytophthora rubi]KAE9295658.1 hypothetical protein PR003_g23954 [Phytophthora rubi]